MLRHTLSSSFEIKTNTFFSVLFKSHVSIWRSFPDGSSKIDKFTQKLFLALLLGKKVMKGYCVQLHPLQLSLVVIICFICVVIITVIRIIVLVYYHTNNWLAFM